MKSNWWDLLTGLTRATARSLATSALVLAALLFLLDGRAGANKWDKWGRACRGQDAARTLGTCYRLDGVDGQIRWYSHFPTEQAAREAREKWDRQHRTSLFCYGTRCTLVERAADRERLLRTIWDFPWRH